MAIAREQIRDFQEKSMILGMGATTGFLLGGFIGLVIGTYAATKYNAVASLDGGALLGIAISAALSLIWLIIVTVWTRKVANVAIWVRLIATNTVCFFVAAFIGYFLGATAGAIGATLLPRIL